MIYNNEVTNIDNYIFEQLTNGVHMTNETEIKTESKTADKTGQKKNNAKRYSPEDKHRLLAEYKAYRKAGDNVKDASKKVGVPYITLHLWENKGKKKKVEKSKTKKGKSAGRAKTKTTNKKNVLKKAVSPNANRSGRKSPRKNKSEGLTLVTPRGYRIEGISPSDLIKVLKALN